LIKNATKEDAQTVAVMLSALGKEIEQKTGATINTDQALIQKLFCENLGDKFRAKLYHEQDEIVAFILFSDSFALYAQGEYITITELYVKPAFRGKNIGKVLLESVLKLAKDEDKIRIELTTPPLPAFEKSLDFYLKNGFEITGGKKVKYEL